MLEVGISTKSAQARTDVLQALAELAPKEQRFGIKIDEYLDHYFVLSGDCEEQIDSLLARLKETITAEIDVGATEVAYRETLSKPVTVKFTHKSQAGGSGEFAEVTIDFEPLPPGSGFVFADELGCGVIPKEFIIAVEKGLNAQKELGLLAGFPVIDFSAKLRDGKYHEVDSSARIFNIAARSALRQLATKERIKLLEPIMRVEVEAPEDSLDGIIADLNHRGQILSNASHNKNRIVIAMVPLTLDYASTLKSLSRGEVSCVMKFDHYAEMPQPPDNDGDDFPPAIGMRA